MIDIVIVNVPRLEVKAPISGPALLKAILIKNGYSCRTYDYNIDLWHTIDSSVIDTWYEIDLTYRYEDRFKTFWDKYVHQDAVEYFKNIVKNDDPEWIGITLFSQRSKFFVLEVLKILKDNHPHIKTVIGGPYSAYVGKRWKNEGIVDAYINGEADEALVELLNGNLDFPGVNGGPAKQITDLNALPIPNYDDLDVSKYSNRWWDPNDKSDLGLKTLYVTGSRGCVRDCSLCDIGQMWPKFKYRTGENIANEMEYLSNKFSLNRIMFTDSLLNGSPTVLDDLTSELIYRYEHNTMKYTTWQGQFIARPENRTNQEMFKNLKLAGCDLLSIGIESGSERVREHMGKKFSNSDLMYTLDMCAKYEIRFVMLMMVGYPTETEEDFQDTLKLFDNCLGYLEKGLILNVVMGGTTSLIPGTPIWRSKDELGITEDKTGFGNIYENWVYGNNDKELRILRWFRLKEHLTNLGFPLLEKQLHHLSSELDKIRQAKKNKIILPMPEGPPAAGPTV